MAEPPQPAVHLTRTANGARFNSPVRPTPPMARDILAPWRMRRARLLKGCLRVSGTGRPAAVPGFRATSCPRRRPWHSGGLNIVVMTAGSSMQAMIFTARPPWLPVSMSMWKTRFKRCAQSLPRTRSGVMEAWRSVDAGSYASGALALLPWHRPGTTCARRWLCGAKTP